MYVTTLVIFCFLALCRSIAVNPGAKMRLTQRGFDYANTVARGVIASELEKIRIPDYYQQNGRYSYWLWNIRVNNVVSPSSNLRPNPYQNGLTWTLSNFRIDISTDWRVRYKRGWFKASTSGSADITVSGVSLRVTAGFGVDRDGLPTITTKQCNSYIGNIDVRFRGRFSWLFNLFRDFAGRFLRGRLTRPICDAVRKSIREDAAAALKKMRVTQEIEDKFILDYGLISPPVISYSYLETLHKGQTYWKANRNGAPFSPDPLPRSSASNNMLYIWGSEFVAKAFAHVAQINNFLEYRVTGNDLTLEQRDLMNTSCTTGFLCAGQFIPHVGQQYPGSQIEVQVTSTETPEVNFRPGNIDLVVYADAQLIVRKPDQTAVSLFTLQTNLSLSVSPSVVNEKILGRITSHNFTVNMNSPLIGQYNRDGLNGFFHNLLTAIVIPGFNRLGLRGINLPVTGDIKFYNTNLQLLDGAILVGTDLLYRYSG